MIALSCPGDYALLEAWIDKHRDADMLVYDQTSGLPIRAEYTNSIYQAYVTGPRRFFEAVRKLSTEGSQDDQS